MLRDYLVKNVLYSIKEFLSTGHKDVEIQTFIFNLFYYFVMHIGALNYCVFYYLFFVICLVLTNFM